MLRDKKIALFIDVDNLGLNYDHYENVLNQLSNMGEIVFGAVYGAGERKHRKIIEHAELNGFIVRRVARTKRRGRKNFDNRIVVDAVDAVLTNRAIDAVCVLSQPTDLIYLYGYLRNKGMDIIAADNNPDEASRNFVNEFIDLGVIELIKLPRPKKVVVKPVVEQQPVAAPEVAPAQAEQPTEQPTLAEEVDHTDALLREIERLRSTTEQYNDVAPTETASTPAPAPEAAQTETAAPETTEAPRYAAQNDGDLIGQIEDIRKNNEGGEPDDLIAQIKKLLDDVE